MPTERASVADAAIVRDAAIAAAWNLQGDLSRADLDEAVQHVLGIALPTIPNTTTRNRDVVALWLGPRSWLLLAESSTPRLDRFEETRDAINTVEGALFDVSASRVAFRVSGAHATSVLASSCPLDLHPRAFAAGACAQSVLGHVNALFYKEDEAPTFVVLVARSFARDVGQALRHAAERCAASC
jgi:sarcosine oxidase, subunit gamma